MPKRPFHPIDNLSTADLRALVLELLNEIAGLKQIVAEQREEIARLKGLKGPPRLKPSGMGQNSAQKDGASGAHKRHGRGKKTLSRVAVEERVVSFDVPAGSRFKGFEDFVVQDLVIQPALVWFSREGWVTPDGRTAARTHCLPFWAGAASLCAHQVPSGSGDRGAVTHAAPGDR